MKKCWIILLLTLLLCGCSTEETFETVEDQEALPVMASPRELSAVLPQDALAPVMDREGEKLYLCDGYEVLMETRAAGDLKATVRSLSGYDREDLTVVETQWQDVTRYDFVWACAGERGDRLGRAVVLDDGDYHYCMSILWDAGEPQGDWDGVFSSVTLR